MRLPTAARSSSLWRFTERVHRSVLCSLLLISACRQRDDVQVGPGTVAEEASLATLRARGRDLFFDRGRCVACHKIAGKGDKERGPNLGIGGGFSDPVAVRAAQRKPDLEPIEYLVESIVDPDAYVVEGYVRGIMKHPDQPPIELADEEMVALAAYLAGGGARPVTTTDVLAARRHIGPARERREQRSLDRWADHVIGRIQWSNCMPHRGAEIYERLGCASCHDESNNVQLKAPTLRGIGGRLSPSDIARWVIAPPPTRMPSYVDTIEPTDLADLCSYLGGNSEL